MRRYENLQDLANKIDHEGGLESFLRYGFQEWAGYFKAALPEPGGDDD